MSTVVSPRLEGVSYSSIVLETAAVRVHGLLATAPRVYTADTVYHINFLIPVAL